MFDLQAVKGSLSGWIYKYHSVEKGSVNIVRLVTVLGQRSHETQRNKAENCIAGNKMSLTSTDLCRLPLSLSFAHAVSKQPIF